MPYGAHFHLLVRMRPGSEFSNADIKRRFKLYYGNNDKRELEEKRVSALREKWGSLSEFVKEIKQGFSRYYNQRHHRKGFFWSELGRRLFPETALGNHLEHEGNPVWNTPHASSSTI